APVDNPPPVFAASGGRGTGTRVGFVTSVWALRVAATLRHPPEDFGVRLATFTRRVAMVTAGFALDAAPVISTRLPTCEAKFWPIPLSITTRPYEMRARESLANCNFAPLRNDTCEEADPVSMTDPSKTVALPQTCALSKVK